MKGFLLAATVLLGMSMTTTAQTLTTTTTVNIKHSYNKAVDLVADETTMQIQKSAIKIESDNPQITMQLMNYFNEGGILRYTVISKNYGATSTMTYRVYIHKSYLPQLQLFFKTLNERTVTQIRAQEESMKTPADTTNRR